MCTGKEALAFLSPLSAKPVFTRIMIARLGLISLKWLWWHLQDFSEATLMTFATFSSSSWSPSSAASLLASRAWAKQIISSSEVSIQNMQKNHVCLSIHFHLIVCHCQTKRMFFFSVRFLSFLCLSDSHQPGSLFSFSLVQLKSFFLSWCQRRPMPGCSCSCQDRGVFSPHDHRHLTALRVHIAWLTV